MAKRLYIASIVFTVATTITSCIKPPCKCEPPTPLPYLQFKIVNQQGQNLVFGPSAIYNVDSIHVLKNYNDFSVDNASVNRSYLDSSNLAFNFYIPAGKSYIYYGRQARTDTLDINWVQKEGKCCGEPFPYYTAEQLKLNGQLLQATNGVFYLLK